jgi:hypothetical protein
MEKMITHSHCRSAASDRSKSKMVEFELFFLMLDYLDAVDV